MVGKNYFEIGEEDFLKGETTSPDTSDGGFSPETTGVNVTATADKTGVLYAPANASSLVDTNGKIIASCADPDSGFGVSRYILTDTARFYSFDTNLSATLRQTGAKTYTKTKSDIIVYGNKLYATSTANITEASGATLGTIDENWWTTTKGKTALTSTPHPLIVFEDSLWIGDGNKLHKWDGTTASEGFLVLPSNHIIVSLSVDPSSGKMLLSISEGINSSDTLPRVAKIGTYDGFSSRLNRVVAVDDMVTAMVPYEGTVFCAYGQNIGYWTGSGIKFLYKLRNASLDAPTLVYKHMITVCGNGLYFADGPAITCYRDTYPGQKKFYKTISFPGILLNSSLEALFNFGSNTLGFGMELTSSAGTYSVYKHILTATTTGTLKFYTKKYKFPRPVFVREVRFEYADSIANNATPAVATLINQEKASIALPVLTNDTGSATYVRNIKYNGPTKFTTLQLYYENSATPSVIAGLRRILIYYEYAE